MCARAHACYVWVYREKKREEKVRHQRWICSILAKIENKKDHPILFGMENRQNSNSTVSAYLNGGLLTRHSRKAESGKRRPTDVRINAMDMRGEAPGFFKEALEHGQFHWVVRKTRCLLDETSDIRGRGLTVLIRVSTVDNAARSLLPRADGIG